MKYIFTIIITLSAGILIHAQQEFHVFPQNHPTTPGKASGNGTFENPWDLETALKQKPEMVNGNDTIWLHGGIYNGRFVSTIKSTIADTYITVSAYKDAKVVLNGNVNSKRDVVLEVIGDRVIYQNLEITWLGDFSRFEGDDSFRLGVGIRHLKGENCKFYNLRIHDVPGLGFGSWKHGAGSIIENCMIYNNGYIAKNGKGRGEGIYVQNKSDETRMIRNNIIFNNFYKGIEVWSASKRADFEYVKHITLENNILFNNGSPSGHFYDNIIVASDDRNGINVAKHISLYNNVLYHNVNFTGEEVRVEAPSLTLGFNKNAPIEDVTVQNNIIIGKFNGLRILHAKSLNFSNNTIYTGYILFSHSDKEYIKNWTFKNNNYFVKTKRPAHRIVSYKDFELEDWQLTYNIDQGSESNHISKFNLKPVLAFKSHHEDDKVFNVALFDKKGHDVTVSISDYGLKSGQNYNIYDAENPDVILKSGQVSENKTIVFPMNSTSFKKPLHNSKTQKTPSNFGVFTIEFEAPTETTVIVEKEENAFERFFKWLGF